MTEPTREAQVLDAVVSLVDTVLDDFDVVDLLTDLTQRCADLLDVASAGLLLADARHRLHLVAATSEQTHDLELFQLQNDQGPCLDAYTSGGPVTVADIRTRTDVWPRFAAAAAAAGVVSVHAVPMRAAGSVLGAMGLFGTQVGELGAADRAVGQALAHIATVAVLLERSPTSSDVRMRLHGALAGRVVVEQAKGFLRERFDITADSAFVLLRHYARTEGRHLTEVARTIVSDPDGRTDVLDGITAIAGGPPT